MIDATPLLVRSAGVKSYMYHWISALLEQPVADHIRLFPYFRGLSQLDHERSCAGKWATRSGKLLRRSLQALAEGRDPGDLTTIEDPAALEQIRMALAAFTP